MNDQDSKQVSGQAHATAQEPPDDVAREPVACSGRRSRWLLVLVLLLVVTTAGAALYGVWWVVQQQKGLSQQLEELRSGIQQEDRMLQELRDEQRALQDDVGDLRAGLSRGSLVRAVTEASFLVRIAHDHLVFAYDLPGAVDTLAAAEQIVRDADDARLTDVMTQFTATLRALRHTEAPDVSRLALQLKAWAARVQELPLAASQLTPAATREPVTEQAAPRWQALLQGFWSELKSLITVRQGGQVAVPLIPPEQQYFLYQNLRLELGVAQASLLHRDTRNLHASLGAVREWINRYFDVRSANTKALLADLDMLEEIDIAPALPELSSLQQALHDVLTSVVGGTRAQTSGSTNTGRIMESTAPIVPL